MKNKPNHSIMSPKQAKRRLVASHDSKAGSNMDRGDPGLSFEPLLEVIGEVLAEIEHDTFFYAVSA
jgi:hypothetical protein